MEPTEEFVAACEELAIVFEGDEVERLGRFLGLLLEANTRFNLTAIRDPQQAWMRHIFDALTLLPLVVSAEAERVIDIGSGGGVPGLPLAIVLPGVGFTLVEATGKKAEFLREAAGELGLGNVKVVQERAETLGQDRAYRERFDVVTARAVGRLNVLLELTAPLAAVGGHVLAVKGGKAEEEIVEAKQALHQLHCAVVDRVRTATGTIVVIEKLRKTPRMYPRRPGEPKRRPL